MKKLLTLISIFLFTFITPATSQNWCCCEIGCILDIFLIGCDPFCAGFGGGSSYLAIMALYELSFHQTRSTALLCNIIVVLGSVVIFHRKELLDWKRAIPMVIISIPDLSEEHPPQMQQEYY